MNKLQEEAVEALRAVLGEFELEHNLKTLAPTIRAMLNNERWQLRLVELLLSSPSQESLVVLALWI
jgi:hypothetical protein